MLLNLALCSLYRITEAVPDLETALYFSTASFTTIGYGDVVLGPQWRLVSAIEGANGLMLFGWSTAFLTTTTSQLSTLEHDWLRGGQYPAIMSIYLLSRRHSPGLSLC